MKSPEDLNAKLNIRGDRFTEEDLIKFDPKVLILFGLVLGFFLLFVAFKMHGSSMGYWNVIFSSPNKKEGILIGTPRGIRSDEWLSATPSILSQSERNFPEENLVVGSGKSALLTNLPTKNFSVLFRPQLWGYYFFGPERGFSFAWGFRTFIFFLAIFSLCLLLTENKFWLSLLAAFWFSASSFTQWWLSTYVTEMFTFASIAFISLAYVLFSKKRTHFFIGIAGLCIAAINFALFLYPPFQIPIVYLFVCLLFGYLYKNRRDLKQKFNFSRFAGLVFAAFIVVAALFAFYGNVQATIRMMMATAYPGNRISVGGEVPWARLFSGYFDFFLRGSNFIKLAANVCEAGTFILLFPLVFVLLIDDKIKQKKIDPVVLALAVYVLIILTYILFGFPPLLVKISLLSVVPSIRAVGGLGGGSILLLILYFSNQETKGRILLPWLLSVSSFLLIVWYGFYLKNANLFNMSSWSVFFTGIIFGVIALGLSKKKLLLFSLPLVLFLLPSLRVNPIAYGFAPIKNKPLYNFAKEIKSENPKSKWLLYGDHVRADFLKASGLEVLNGSQYVPNRDLLAKIDPKNRYLSISNRSGHDQFLEPGPTGQTEIILDQNDLYTIKVDPCSSSLREAGITNLAFSYKPDQVKLSCLVPTAQEDVGGIWFYGLK